MPSNKPKVSAFLEQDELEALVDFTKEDSISYSEGIKRLIRKQLIEDSQTQLNPVLNTSYDARVDRLEETVEASKNSLCCCVEKQEKIEEQIAYLQSQISTLTLQLKRNSLEYFTDEQIASYVGAREETVREWRLGLRKPRGSRVCTLLNEFELDYGRWIKKDYK